MDACASPRRRIEHAVQALVRVRSSFSMLLWIPLHGGSVPCHAAGRGSIRRGVVRRRRCRVRDRICAPPVSPAERSPARVSSAPHVVIIGAPTPIKLTTPPNASSNALPLVPDGGLIAGWAAAYVHGVNTLDGLDHHTLAPLPVPIVLPPGMRRRDTATVTYRQSSRRARGELVNDIPVTSVWRTIVDLTSHAPDLTEAVVAVDAFLAARLVTREILDRNLAGTRRAPRRTPDARGDRAGQTRRAEHLGDPTPRSSPSRNWAGRISSPTGQSSTSPVSSSGCPTCSRSSPPWPSSTTARAGRPAAGTGTAIVNQHREDNAREERLERAGLVVVRADKADLVQHRRWRWPIGCDPRRRTDSAGTGAETAGRWTSRSTGSGCLAEVDGAEKEVSDTRSGPGACPILLLEPPS